MVVHTEKLVLAHTHEAMELNYFKTTHLIQICEDSFDLLTSCLQLHRKNTSFILVYYTMMSDTVRMGLP